MATKRGKRTGLRARSKNARITMDERQELYLLREEVDGLRATIAKQEQALLDHAEDWAMAGIPTNSSLAAQLTQHYHQRAHERDQLRRCRVIMEVNDPGNFRDIFGSEFTAKAEAETPKAECLEDVYV